MELNSPHIFTFHLISSDIYFICRGNLLEVIRDSSNRITMTHPYLRILTHSFEQHIILAERSQMRTPIFACTSRFYLSIVGIRHKLCTIADTQNRIFATNLTQIYLEGIFIINRKRTSGKDDSFNCCIFFRKLVIRNNFAIRVQFAYATTNQLCCLRTEIKNYYFLLHINGWILNK